MEYETFLNKVKTNLKNTNNYFDSEINEIVEVVKNSISCEDIIDVKSLDVLLYKFKCYILRLTNKNEK